MLTKRWLPFLLFASLIIGITIADNLGQIHGIVNLITSVPGGDKLGHALFIGTLAFLLNYALAGRMVRVGQLSILLGCLIVAVAMTAEEFSQIWIPARNFDLLDLAANYLGITVAGWLWLRSHPK